MEKLRVRLKAGAFLTGSVIGGAVEFGDYGIRDAVDVLLGRGD